MLLTEAKELELVGEPLGEPRWLIRKPERGPERVGVAGDEECPHVVGRNEERSVPDPLGQLKAFDLVIVGRFDEPNVPTGVLSFNRRGDLFRTITLFLGVHARSLVAALVFAAGDGFGIG